MMSWVRLHPKPEIILFGNAQGTADICRELGLRHIPEVECNEFGTPLVDDLFQKAQRLANYDLICYINADIVVTQSLIEAINIISQLWKRFVVSSSTWDLSMKEAIDFNFPDWQGQLRDLVQKKANAPLSIGMDLFLFPRGFYHDIPPFLLGRKAWDNWLIFKACSGRIPFIDTSEFMLIVHLQHEKSTHSSYLEDTEEMQLNERLSGWWPRTFIGRDVPYKLGKDGRLQKRSVFKLLSYRLQAIRSHSFICRLCGGIPYFLRKLGFLSNQ